MFLPDEEVDNQLDLTSSLHLHLRELIDLAAVVTTNIERHFGQLEEIAHSKDLPLTTEK